MREFNTMKLLLILVVLGLFLINPVLGMIGLVLILAGIFGYIFLNAKLEKKSGKQVTPQPKKEHKGKDDLEWIDRIEEYDAATDDSE